MKNCCSKTLISAILLVASTGILVYANTFHAPFVFDDIDSIVRNDVIKDLANFFDNSSGYDFLPNRYITYLSFALNHHFDGLNVFAYHLVNLAIHTLNACLVFALLKLILQTPYFQPPGTTQIMGDRRSVKPLAADILPTRFSPQIFIPLLAALLFVAHPVQTQAVTYIVQRATSLATLFYLVSLCFYVMARLRLEARHDPGMDSPGTDRQGGRSRRVAVGLMAGSFLVAVLAMKTKEISFTLPVAAGLLELLFFTGAFKKRLLYLLPLFTTLLIIPATIFSQGDALVQGNVLDVEQSFRVDTDISRLAYLCTQFRVIVTYLRLLVLPIRQNLDYDYPLYTDFVSPPVFLSFILLAALFTSAIYLCLRTGKSHALHAAEFSVDDQGDPNPSRSPKQQNMISELRLVAFGLLWFFMTLSVESSFVPIVDVIMEHRLYLPSFGAAIVVAVLVARLLRMLGGRAGRVLLLAGVAMVVISLGYATWQRNYVWGDAVRLWTDVVEKSPMKARPYNNLGLALTESGQVPKAIETLSKAIQLDPNQPNPYHNLGRAYILHGRSQAAVPMLQRAIRLKPDFLDAYISLAAAYNQLGQPLNTISLLEANLDWIGPRFEPYYHLANAYAMIGKWDAYGNARSMAARFDPLRVKELDKFYRID